MIFRMLHLPGSGAQSSSAPAAPVIETATISAPRRNRSSRSEISLIRVTIIKDRVALMAQARLGIIVIFVIATGCAIHKSPIQTYRLVAVGANPVLVPPGVATPDLAQRTLKA